MWRAESAGQGGPKGPHSTPHIHTQDVLGVRHIKCVRMLVYCDFIWVMLVWAHF